MIVSYGFPYERKRVIFQGSLSQHQNENLGQLSGFRTFASDGYSERSSSDFSFGSL